jgi:hypothetical protein
MATDPVCQTAKIFRPNRNSAIDMLANAARIVNVARAPPW